MASPNFEDEKGRKPQIIGFGGGASVTPSDSADLARCSSALWVGVSGNVRVTTIKGDDLTFLSVPIGWFECRAKKVWSTSTTATNIIAVWE